MPNKQPLYIQTTDKQQNSTRRADTPPIPNRYPYLMELPPYPMEPTHYGTTSSPYRTISPPYETTSPPYVPYRTCRTNSPAE